jgi:beta-galactosidase
MYVMDEAFDMWTRFKSDYDYAQSFGEWWEHDIEAMVQKDYNHPSVLLYSIGNEIPEIGGFHGAKFAKMLSDKIKSLDPGRYTLAAINGVFAAGEDVPKIMQDIMGKLKPSEENNDGTKDGGAAHEQVKHDEAEHDEVVQDEAAGGNVNEFLTILDSHMDEIVTHPLISKRLDIACATTDIAGYNYMTARYVPDAINYPNRVIVGSETYPPEIGRNWEIIKKSPHVIGDFTWTGWDYIGEAGVGIPAYQFGEGGFGAQFPCQLAYCGDIDITGFRRPASYYREIVFGRRNAPYIAVQNPAHYGERLIKTPWIISDSISSWTFNSFEEKPVVIEVYSAGEEVELLQDGVSLGKKPAGPLSNFMALFETKYRKGKLTAVSYQAGVEQGRMELVTALDKDQIKICPEFNPANAGNQELIYVPITVTDKNGILCTDEKIKINVSIEGSAKLIGFGSGNPKPQYNYNESSTETFEGRALLILKKTGDKGTIRITIDAGEYQKATCELKL